MTELEAAEQVRDGLLPSPTVFGGMTLFSLRITGTGMSYRAGLDEYVWRSPAHYLTDEFLARCLGLPLIWQHPDKAVLNSQEFADRVIGTVMLSFVRNEEVWAVCRVYDSAAIKAMTDGQLSTSPAVVFKPTDGNKTVELEEGKKLLLEGKPSYLDHIAVCDLGVWDAGGPPVGIQNDTLETTTDNSEANERADSMTDDEKAAAADKARKDAEDKAKADADAGQKLDKLLTHLDSITNRLDAMEMADKARKDAEEKEKADRADASRRDAAARRDAEHEEWKKADAETCAKDDAEEEAEAKELEAKGEPKEVAADKARKDRKDRMDARRKDAEEKAKADAEAARKDSVDIEAMRRRLAALEAAAKGMPEEERAAFADHQARADGAYISLGSRAPAPMQGENLLAYRTRLARGLQKHSPDWKGVDLVKLPPEALAVAEHKIYADADIAARNPDDVELGTLREINKVDPSTGQRMTTFVGRGTFIGGMKRPSRRLIGINTKAS